MNNEKTYAIKLTSDELLLLRQTLRTVFDAYKILSDTSAISISLDNQVHKPKHLDSYSPIFIGRNGV